MTQGLGGGEGNRSLGKKGVSVPRRPTSERGTVVPHAGLSRLFLALVGSRVTFEMGLFE